jgi:glycosyltransferase involved in cell wall biosynthesis
MRIAWFTPLPPGPPSRQHPSRVGVASSKLADEEAQRVRAARSGIAAYSAEILPLLRLRYEGIDVFVDRAPSVDEPDVFSAHDFVWKQRRRPYDLTVFQMGNAACHGYMWAYLFRYPGLVVLHDAQLHQARALWLMKRYRPRYDDYISEFRATEPQAPPDAAYVIAAGLGESALYQHWPLVRLVLESARLSVVHNTWLRAHLAERYPAATIDAIEMGVADPALALAAPKLAGERVASEGGEARTSILIRHGIPADAVVIAAFGGVTPEKRLGPLIQAIGMIQDRVPALHLMLVGDEAPHYDVRADATRWGISDRVHVTGYVADADVPSYLAAADICSCLRWPTNRETSASWLRAIAAGKPTLITALAQLADLPPIAVSIDVLDEEHALPQALESLATDPGYRARLGRAAREYWNARHRLEQMASGYERVIARAVSLPAPVPDLPAHLRNDGSERLRAIAGEMGVSTNVLDLFD